MSRYNVDNSHHISNLKTKLESILCRKGKMKKIVGRNRSIKIRADNKGSIYLFVTGTRIKSLFFR